MKHNRIFNYFILFLGIICILYYLGMGLAVRFGQSLLFIWPLIGLACIFRFIIVSRAIKSGKDLPIPKRLIKAFRICLAAALSIFLFVEYFVCSGAMQRPEKDLDCIIILGARVNGNKPSGALSQRILAASNYLRSNPRSVCIASGAQGDDEQISEADCIIENLLYLGISPERLICEDEATDTVSNIENSLKLLPEGAERIGIVTNDFHIFRAMAVARKLSDLSFSPIPAKSTAYGFVHYAMREFFALGEGVLKGELKF